MAQPLPIQKMLVKSCQGPSRAPLTCTVSNRKVPCDMNRTSSVPWPSKRNPPFPLQCLPDLLQPGGHSVTPELPAPLVGGSRWPVQMQQLSHPSSLSLPYPQSISLCLIFLGSQESCFLVLLLPWQCLGDSGVSLFILVSPLVLLNGKHCWAFYAPECHSSHRPWPERAFHAPACAALLCDVCMALPRAGSAFPTTKPCVRSSRGWCSRRKLGSSSKA